MLEAISMDPSTVYKQKRMFEDACNVNVQLIYRDSRQHQKVILKDIIRTSEGKDH